MPCRAFLAQLRERKEEIESLGAGVVGVGTGADFQARQLMARGVPFPLLVDPERNLYRVLGLEHIRWHRFLQPSTWWRYLRSARVARQGRLTGDVRQSPGVAIIDTDRRIRYLHRGTTLGDYPPVEEVLQALRAVTGDGG